MGNIYVNQVFLRAFSIRLIVSSFYFVERCAFTEISIQAFSRERFLLRKKYIEVIKYEPYLCLRNYLYCLTHTHSLPRWPFLSVSLSLSLSTFFIYVII